MKAPAIRSAPTYTPIIEYIWAYLYLCKRVFLNFLILQIEYISELIVYGIRRWIKEYCPGLIVWIGIADKETIIKSATQKRPASLCRAVPFLVRKI